MSALFAFNLTTTDDKSYDVKVVMADLVRYDIQRNKLGFPPKEGNEFSFMALVSYCSLVRTGQISATTKAEDFINTIANLEPVVEEESDATFPAESGN